MYLVIFTGRDFKLVFGTNQKSFSTMTEEDYLYFADFNLNCIMHHIVCLTTPLNNKLKKILSCISLLRTSLLFSFLIFTPKAYDKSHKFG